MVPSVVPVADATLDTVGWFINLRAAADPDQELEWVKPVPVVWKGSRAALEPRADTVVMRLVTAKQIKMNPGQCVKLG